MNDATATRPAAGSDEAAADWRRTLRSKQEFVRDVRSAVAAGTGFAAGKIGHSEQRLLMYRLRHREPLNSLQRRALALGLQPIALECLGIFPPTRDTLLEHATFLAEQIHRFDYLGLFLDHMTPGTEDQLLRAHGWPAKLTFYINQEPDRSIPDNPDLCYLDSLRGKRLLLVSPMADFLRSRACPDLFEAVWARTGKRWFEPASVEAVEFPYGFDTETWRRYPTVRHLLADIERQVAAKDFDVALIAAAGLGIPLTVFIKNLGKTAIALGGHLQVVFGVLGDRWRTNPEWQRNYFTDAWVDLPARYRPRGPRLNTYDYW